MIIPLNHDNMYSRRWPYVTTVIVAINVLVFLFTHGRIEKEAIQLHEVQEHILLLAAVHPNVQTTSAEQDMIDTFKRSNPKTWSWWGSPSRNPGTLFDLQIHTWEMDRANSEMASLDRQLEDLRQNSFVARYAFYPSHPAPVSYLSANFLHGGWLHLIFNMWFLWLAGAILEDVWGRPIYTAFYLISGAAALGAYGLIYPSSLVPVIGASGAIASAMGAFLIRFPKTKIHLVFIAWFLSVRLYRFKAPAYAVLPLWLLGQLFWGLMAGEGAGVAYWAHIGGFAFGVLGALALRYTGIERAVDKAIESKVSWTTDPRIVQANESLEKNQPDAAIAELKKVFADQPENLDAHALLANVYWRKSDVPAHRQELETVCRLHLKANQPEAAWQDYQDYSNAGGDKMPAATWLGICRFLEGQQNWERAAEEYEKLAQKWPADRASVMALISAGRIHLKQLNSRDRAAKFYAAAQASPVPHLDWDETIRRGLAEANGNAQGQTEPAPIGSLPGGRRA